MAHNEDAGRAAIFLQTFVALSRDDAPRTRRRRHWTLLSAAALLVFAAMAYHLVRERAAGGVTDRLAETPITSDAPPAEPLELFGARPPSRRLTLHVGESEAFAVEARGTHLRYRWSIDGKVVSRAPLFSYAPAVGQAGRRAVALTIDGVDGTIRRDWEVFVRPPRAPRILASPDASRLRVAVGDEVQLHLDARAATPHERLRIGWTINGEPAGEAASLTVRPKRARKMVVRAVAASDFGVAAAHTWHLNVRSARAEHVRSGGPAAQASSGPAAIRSGRGRRARAESTIRTDEQAREADADALADSPAATDQAFEAAIDAVAGESPPATDQAAEAGVDVDALGNERPTVMIIGDSDGGKVTESDAPVARATRPEVIAANATKAAAITRSEIEALLDRYAAAWQRHDIRALQALRQVRRGEQSDTLRRYFATVGDLEVEADLLAIAVNGTRTTVRFVRRDRFRDKTGRKVMRESRMEKDILRTPSGLVFSRPRR